MEGTPQCRSSRFLGTDHITVSSVREQSMPGLVQVWRTVPRGLLSNVVTRPEVGVPNPGAAAILSDIDRGNVTALREEKEENGWRKKLPNIGRGDRRRHRRFGNNARRTAQIIFVFLRRGPFSVSLFSVLIHSLCATSQPTVEVCVRTLCCDGV